eukprot:5730568-Alexandrium_andersonii.AAC.1
MDLESGLEGSQRRRPKGLRALGVARSRVLGQRTGRGKDRTAQGEGPPPARAEAGGRAPRGRR